MCDFFCERHNCSCSKALKTLKTKCGCSSCCKWKAHKNWKDYVRPNYPKRPSYWTEEMFNSFELYYETKQEIGRKDYARRPTETLERCPIHGCSVLTGYSKLKCKCTACSEGYAAYQKERNQDPHKRMQNSWHNWKGKGGIATFEEYKAASEQDYCDCCGVKLPDRSERCVDHCHTTGRLRGTLCRGCNAAEGQLKTIARCEQLIQYMKDRCNV